MKNVRLLSMALILTLILTTIVGCSKSNLRATDLMDGVTAESLSDRDSSAPAISNPAGSGENGSDQNVTDSAAFSHSQMSFAVNLFQWAARNNQNENVLLSPLSIQAALAMTANGAAGQTLQEMEDVICGGQSIPSWNQALSTYLASLPVGDNYRLSIANSIWFRDKESLDVKKDFLQTNADYYGAQIYKAAFDEQTCADINQWVSDHTDGMIDKIIDSIQEETVLYLINALAFDAEWKNLYMKSDIRTGTFTNIYGEEQSVEMMHSEERNYIQTDEVIGFAKDYIGQTYQFVALLPQEGVDIYDYIERLDADTLQDLLQNMQSGMVAATIPKFSYEYEMDMNDMLSELGMPTAFNSLAADFSSMASSADGNLYIGESIHKTFIDVNENGTKAGAATGIAIQEECAYVMELEICLDRPFLYFIIDTTYQLPVFVGIVTDIPS